MLFSWYKLTLWCFSLGLNDVTMWAIVIGLTALSYPADSGSLYFWRILAKPVHYHLTLDEGVVLR